jgi:hypothetical protein
MLLSKMTRGSVGAEISVRSSGRTLRSVRKLSNSPHQVGPDGAESMLAMLMSASSNVLADQLRSEGLASTVSLCESSVLAAEYMPSPVARDRLLIGSKDSVQNVANIFVRR